MNSLLFRFQPMKKMRTKTVNSNFSKVEKVSFVFIRFYFRFKMSLNDLRKRRQKNHLRMPAILGDNQPNVTVRRAKFDSGTRTAAIYTAGTLG